MMRKDVAKGKGCPTRPTRQSGSIGPREQDLNALIEVLAKLSERGGERAEMFVRDGRKNPAKREEWAAGVVGQLEDAIVRLLLRRHRNEMGEFALKLLAQVSSLENESRMIAEGGRLSLIRSLIDLREQPPFMEELLIAGAKYATVADVYGPSATSPSSATGSATVGGD